MVKQKPVIILGAGEHGRVVRNIFFLTGREKVHFLDDNTDKPDVIGSLVDLDKYHSDYDFFISFGNNAFRQKWYENLKKSGRNLVNAIHPQAYLEKSVKYGDNVMIGANTYINISTSLGNNVIVNNSCNLDHDNIIEDHVQIAPGTTMGGGVTIKKGTFLGIGSTVIDHITIGKNNLVGGGAVVVDNLEEENCLYLGIPAKKFKNL